jgi:hypothetical protein
MGVEQRGDLREVIEELIGDWSRVEQMMMLRL